MDELRTLLSTDKIDFITKISSVVIEKKIDGDIVECGVYKGGCAKHLLSLFKNKKLHLFDSFSGFCKEDTLENYFHTGSFSDTSLKEVQDYLSNENCIFYPGWLPESANNFKNKISLVHMDMDYYESTIKSIPIFWPLIVNGGVMIFDDWEDGCCPGVKVAINEYFQNIEHFKIIYNHQCAIFKYDI